MCCKVRQTILCKAVFKRIVSIHKHISGLPSTNNLHKNTSEFKIINADILKSGLTCFQCKKRTIRVFMGLLLVQKNVYVQTLFHYSLSFSLPPPQRKPGWFILIQVSKVI